MCIYSAPKYCVYLTTYRGNKLPPFYIGSTLLDKINSGYRGSVKSKKYKNIFQEELRNNPHLFQTKIIATYFSRKKAQYKEKIFQTKLKVVNSDMYINMSIAKDFGWFGMRTGKEDSPVFGKRWKKTPEQIESCRLACKIAFNRPEVKIAMSKARKNKLPMSEAAKQKLFELYNKIFELYNLKPDIQYSIKSKNGKLMTYERAFANTFYARFDLSSNGLHQILTKPRIGIHRA